MWISHKSESARIDLYTILQEEEEQRSLGPKSIKFINTLGDDVNRKAKIDSIFGIRKEGDIWKIGNKRVTLNPDDSMVVGEEIYEGTPGFGSSW